MITLLNTSFLFALTNRSDGGAKRPPACRRRRRHRTYTRILTAQRHIASHLSTLRLM